MRKLLSIFILLLSFKGGVVYSASLPDFTELVSEYDSAVVNISTTNKIEKKTKTKKYRRFNIPEFGNSPFDDFFERFFEGNPYSPFRDQDQARKAKSLGSGFIISEDGFVLTNHHVIKDASEIIVRLDDKRELKAKLIGSDAKSDIALLKIKATDLPFVKIGSSKDLKVGEWVFAIGSPFGFDHSVTAGIVSAIGRALPNENYVPFIQTDVAINPGNSGGPLFNMEGEVVGVNSQIYSRSGGFMGLSFSVPIDLAMNVVTQIKEKGVVSRGWLGVMIQEVSLSLAQSFGMEKPTGALVAQVQDNSPAKKAGVIAGDIILKFNGVDVEKSSNLPPMVGQFPVGKYAPVLILRQGQKKIVRIKIEQLPGTEDEKQSSNKSFNNVLNIKVKEISAKKRQNIRINKGGVEVSAVSKGPAFDAGIRTGHIITMIDNQKIRNVSHFKQIVKNIKDKNVVSALVYSNNTVTFLAIRLK
jgi:serine protease Do